MIARGSFEVTMNAEPPYDEVEGVSLSRAGFAKRFAGPLDETRLAEVELAERGTAVQAEVAILGDHRSAHC